MLGAHTLSPSLRTSHLSQTVLGLMMRSHLAVLLSDEFRSRAVFLRPEAGAGMMPAGGRRSGTSGSLRRQSTMRPTRPYNMESQRYVDELMGEQQREGRQPGLGHGFVRWSEMQVLYPRYKSLDDINLSAEEFAYGWIDLEPYMNAAPPTIPSCASLHRAYKFFRSLGLRHLCVIGKSGEIRGILTRKDLTYDNAERHVRWVTGCDLCVPRTLRLYLLITA